MFQLTRRFSSSIPQKAIVRARLINQWPHIDRPSLSAAVSSVFLKEIPEEVTWLVGGVGSGKTECVLRTLSRIARHPKRSTYCLVFDFAEFPPIDLFSDNSLALALSKSLASQLSRQVSPVDLWQALKLIVIDLDGVLSEFALAHPVWGPLLKKSKTSEEFWNLMISSSSALESIFPSIRLSNDSNKELDMHLQIMKALGKNVAVALLHIEHLTQLPVIVNGKGGAVSKLLSSGFNVLAECNDSLRTIWNICEGDVNIIEVEDLPKEAVRAIFVPNLLSDETHVETLFSICGGRVSALEKLLVPLNILIEEQKVQDQKQEQEFNTGRERRPSNESKALQVNPLVYSREILLRDSLDDEKVFKPNVDAFESSMNQIIAALGTQIDVKVLIIETLRLVAQRLRKNGSLALPSGLAPSEIAHPVILQLLKHNQLRVAWLPYPRLVPENPIKLLLMECWASAQTEALPLHERIQYNLVLLKNKLHLEKQLDKLKPK